MHTPIDYIQDKKIIHGGWQQLSAGVRAADCIQKANLKCTTDQWFVSDIVGGSAMTFS